jgi:hypothetical protein
MQRPLRVATDARKRQPESKRKGYKSRLCNRLFFCSGGPLYIWSHLEGRWFDWHHPPGHADMRYMYFLRLKRGMYRAQPE